jgi:hypothetical protein
LSKTAEVVNLAKGSIPNGFSRLPINGGAAMRGTIKENDMKNKNKYMVRPERTNQELVELEENLLRSMPGSKELEQQYLDDLANGK